VKIFDLGFLAELQQISAPKTPFAYPVFFIHAADSRPVFQFIP